MPSDELTYKVELVDKLRDDYQCNPEELALFFDYAIDDINEDLPGTATMRLRQLAAYAEVMALALDKIYKERWLGEELKK